MSGRHWQHLTRGLWLAGIFGATRIALPGRHTSLCKRSCRRAPARGDTIAYTAMYVDREGRSWWRRKSQPARARGSDAANGDRSLIALATEAFPHFQLRSEERRVGKGSISQLW